MKDTDEAKSALNGLGSGLVAIMRMASQDVEQVLEPYMTEVLLGWIVLCMCSCVAPVRLDERRLAWWWEGTPHHRELKYIQSSK